MLCKGPNDNYEYSIDWTNELGGDTINGSTWVAEAGITIDGDTFTASSADVDLSGGTAGTTYKLTNQITTLGGDVFEKEIHIKCQIQLAS